jgi:hypothetical protein
MLDQLGRLLRAVLSAWPGFPDGAFRRRCGKRSRGEGPASRLDGEPADLVQPAGPDGGPYLATIRSLILS